MRLVAVTLAFAVLSLAFAPVPLPKSERPLRETQQHRVIRECQSSLREFGMSWVLDDRDGVPWVRFESRDRNGDVDFRLCFSVQDGDVPRAL